MVAQGASGAQPGSDIEVFQEVLRRVSVSRLKVLSKQDSFDVRPVDSNDQVFGYWMSLILLSSNAVRLIFKCHYMTKDVRHLARHAYGKSPRLLSQRQASDFMKEYCNLTAGAIKTLLRNQGLQVGVSLPIVTRGFDALFFVNPDEMQVVEDKWVIASESERIACSILLEVYDPSVLKGIKLGDENQSKDDGEVDFL